MPNEVKFQWNSDKGAWAGPCPRCGMAGYFPPTHTSPLGNYLIDILHCSGGHPFIAEYNRNRAAFLKVYPSEWFGDAPDWLPEEYTSVFAKLLEAQARIDFRSVIALCGILLEAHVNEQIPTEGDKKKSLFDRLEYLKKQGKIDHDQFSDATITRITRNGVLHPKEILAEPSEKDAADAINAVVSYLGRAYAYRTSRALPPGEANEISKPTPQKREEK